MATQIKDMPGTQSPLSAVPLLAEAIRPAGTAVAPGASSDDEEAAANAAANTSNRIKYSQHWPYNAYQRLGQAEPAPDLRQLSPTPPCPVNCLRMHAGGGTRPEAVFETIGFVYRMNRLG